jgi:hypothetical protein
VRDYLCGEIRADHGSLLSPNTAETGLGGW